MKFLSQVYTAVSGSIGGITYAHNAGGMYARGRATPTNPASARQQVMRMYMDSCVTYWTETLSEAERNTWRTYAANVPLINPLGAAILVTGQNMFVRSGVPWLLAGKDLADIAIGPTIYDTGDPGTLSLSNVTESGQTFDIDIAGEPGWAGQDEGGLFAFMGNPQNESVRFYKSPFRFVGFVPGDGVTPITTSQFDATDADPPLSFAQGQRVFVRARAQYDDGRLTQAFVFDALAGA